MINDYFAATSSRFLLAAAVCSLLCLIFKALDKWDDLITAREIRRLEFETWQPTASKEWTWCLLVAEGYYAGPTRRITEMEWRGASADIHRELARLEGYGEPCEGRR